jgi:predicted ester cyclase
MSIEENKALVRRFFAALNAQDAATLTDVFATPELAQGFVDAARWAVETYGAEHHIEPVELVGEGDTVMVRIASRGGHTGTWQGVPPTGKQWTNTAFARFRIAGGRIAEEHFVFDNLGLLKQLGATIAPPT